MLWESHISAANEEVEWFPEPYCKDENVNATFRHVNCLRIGYTGSFVDGMCQNCSGIEMINTFRCKVWRRFNESKQLAELASKVRFDYLTHSQLCEN